MLRRWLVLCGLMVLGCAGITEKAVEISTGGQLEIGEDGAVTMTMADGTTVVTEPKGAIPEGFPLPLPWDDAQTQSVLTTTRPDGDVSWVVTFDLEATRESVLDRYRAWFEEQGVEPKHEKQNLAGMVTESLVGELEGRGAALISVTEAYGANTVSVIWAPGGVDSLDPGR